jgi:hypothetical protein
MTTKTINEQTIELQMKKVFPELFKKEMKEFDFLGTFKSSMEKYLDTYVKIKFQSDELIDIEDRPAWNKGEKFQFKMYVYNNGPIDLKNVILRIQGSEFALVSPFKEEGQFDEFFLKDIGIIDAFGAKQVPGFIYGKLIKQTIDQKEPLIKARIIEWKPSLEHLFTDKVKWGPIFPGVKHIVK